MPRPSHRADVATDFRKISDAAFVRYRYTHGTPSLQYRIYNKAM